MPQQPDNVQDLRNQINPLATQKDCDWLCQLNKVAGVLALGAALIGLVAIFYSTQKLSWIDVEPGEFKPGYSNYGHTHRTLRYAKSANGMVYLDGFVHGCHTQEGSKPIFVLPKGYRPIQHVIFSTIGVMAGGGAGPARIAILPNGNVVYLQLWSRINSNAMTSPPVPKKCPNGSWVTLTNISFYAEK